MQVSNDLLEEITNHLNKSNETEKKIHKIEMQRLDKKEIDFDFEENELIKMRMKGFINDDKFSKNTKELQEENLR